MSKALKDVEAKIRNNAKTAVKLLDTEITYKSSNSQYQCSVPLLGLSGFGDSDEEATENALSAAENELSIRPSLIDDILKGRVR